jgi:hypothetical protein
MKSMNATGSTCRTTYQLLRTRLSFIIAMEYNVCMSQICETAFEIDQLAPFEIWEVMLDNSTIKFFKPFIVQPKILQSEEPDDPTYWTVNVPELGLSAFGTDHESLWDCVQSCIRMSWTEYVCEDDGKLAPLAKSYKDAYLAIAEEVDE